MAVKKSDKNDKKEEFSAEEEKNETKAPEGDKYYYAVGKRKTAVAQVRIYSQAKAKEGDLEINGRKIKEYFPILSLQNVFFAPFRVTGLQNKFKVSVVVKGGGINSQAEAIRLGISRALVKFDGDLKKTLKAYKFLTRDARVVERKKPGLKKARRAPQWAKR